jgi:hypothetical protein
VPLVIVTIVPLIEHTPLAVMVGTDVVVPLLFVVTVKLEAYGAVAGAPVKVTVGEILAAVAVCVIDFAP